MKSLLQELIRGPMPKLARGEVIVDIKCEADYRTSGRGCVAGLMRFEVKTAHYIRPRPRDSAVWEHKTYERVKKGRKLVWLMTQHSRETLGSLARFHSYEELNR
jgi:hypothetical protein